MTQVAAEGELFLLPASGQVQLLVRLKHTEQRRGREQQVCSGSKKTFPDDPLQDGSQTSTVIDLVCPLLRTVLSSKQFNVDYVREITRRSSVEDDVMRILVRDLGRHVGNFQLAAMHVPVAEGSSLKYAQMFLTEQLQTSREVNHTMFAKLKRQ